MAGVVLPGWQPPPQNKKPTNLFGNPASFTGAADTQAADYDRIMADYNKIISGGGNIGGSGNSTSNNQIKFSPIAPGNQIKFDPVKFNSSQAETTNYQQSGDVTNSLSTLRGLSESGGYSDSDIANLRSRGASPIRSMYANYQQNMNRQKSLQGGYSPNLTASMAKMGRDQSQALSDASINSEASIADNRARGRLSGAGMYSSAAAGESAQRTAAEQRNTDIINQNNQANVNRALDVDKFNTSGALDTNKFNTNTILDINKFNSSGTLDANKFNSNTAFDRDRFNTNSVLQAIQGKTSLYGTTPALTNTFGNQVVQAGNLGINQQDAQNRRLNTFGGVAGVRLR